MDERVWDVGGAVVATAAAQGRPASLDDHVAGPGALADGSDCGARPSATYMHFEPASAEPNSHPTAEIIPCQSEEMRRIKGGNSDLIHRDGLPMKPRTVELDALAVDKLNRAIHSTDVVSGLTHSFYRYPARFSPAFARAVIETFSAPGDLVFDPFSGGGTSLVESRVLGRRAIGVDISSLATFVSRAKTTLLTEEDRQTVEVWARKVLAKGLNLRQTSSRPTEWIEAGYQHNIDRKNTWGIRKSTELILNKVERLPLPRQQQFARCVTLRSVQWALDNQRDIPSAAEFRSQFSTYLDDMISGSREFSNAAHAADRMYEVGTGVRVKSLCASSIGIEKKGSVKNSGAPKLVLTSPPYAGVHVLYHRWQVQGRRETRAPFWIANMRDGHYGSYYTFGDRKQPELTSYFMQAGDAFSSIRKLADSDTIVVQLVAFAEPEWQLPRYLEMMERSGFVERLLPSLANAGDGRIWRHVPNRKWYAHQRGLTGGSHEIVLFHAVR